MKNFIVACIIGLAIMVPTKAKAFDFLDGLATVLIVDEIFTPPPPPVIIQTPAPAPVAPVQVMAPVHVAPTRAASRHSGDSREIELMQEDIDYLLRQLHDLERKMRRLEK